MPKPLVICCCVSLLFLTSCWDRIEIEDRGFVIAIGIDLSESGQYLLTEQIAVPGGQSAQAGQGGAGGGTFLNVVGTGPSIMDIIREASAKTNRAPFYEHIKVILISKDVAKTPKFDDALDFFIRSPEMRRATKIMITEDKASDILKNTQPGATIPGLYIDKITANPYQNERIISPTLIGDINEALYQEKSFMIQHIFTKHETLDIEGAAVFHGNTTHLAGILSPEQTAGLSFLTANAKGGTISGQYHNHEISLLVKNSERKITAVDLSHPQHLKFKLDINIEGNMLETGTSINFIDTSIRSDIQKAFEKSLNKQIQETLQLIQKQYTTDIIGISDYMRIHHWDRWQQIENNWEKNNKYFKDVDIDVNTYIFIRNTGTINRTKKENDSDGRD
nr:Ger(x)C family spore germination protein [Pullulanibacillus pueri]